MEDNSLKEASVLFELLKTKFKEKSLKLLHHKYKRKYVVGEELRTYDNFNLIEDKCNFERYTSDVFGDENKGLNRDGWKFSFVGCFEGSSYETTKTFTTWFKNRHKNYGTLIHEIGWSCSPYLNIDNLGREFELPDKVSLNDWVEPHELIKNIYNQK